MKSTYLIIQEDRENNHASNNSGFFRKLWNLKVPPKIKNILWRAVTGCLPAKDRLTAKKVNIISICPRHNVKPKSVMHMLVTCSLERVYWDVYTANDCRAKVMVYWAL